MTSVLNNPEYTKLAEQVSDIILEKESCEISHRLPVESLMFPISVDGGINLLRYNKLIDIAEMAKLPLQAKLNTIQYAINATPIWRQRVILKRIQDACMSGAAKLRLPLIDGDEIPLYIQLLPKLNTLSLDYLKWSRVLKEDKNHKLKWLSRLSYLSHNVREGILRELLEDNGLRLNRLNLNLHSIPAALKKLFDIYITCREKQNSLRMEIPLTKLEKSALVLLQELSPLSLRKHSAGFYPNTPYVTTTDHLTSFPVLYAQTNLQIYGLHMDHLNWLSNFPNLRTLALINVRLGSLEGIWHAEKLETLTLTYADYKDEGKKINNLWGIEKLPHLRQLRINQSVVEMLSDLDVLQQCGMLQKIVLAPRFFSEDRLQTVPDVLRSASAPAGVQVFMCDKNLLLNDKIEEGSSFEEDKIIEVGRFELLPASTGNGSQDQIQQNVNSRLSHDMAALVEHHATAIHSGKTMFLDTLQAPIQPRQYRRHNYL